MVRETGVQSQVASYQRLLKWYLIPPCLTLSNISYISRVKWSNPGKGVAPSPTPRCSSYRKGSLWITLDYGSQLYFTFTYSSLRFSSHTWNEAMHNVSAHQLPQRTPNTALTGSVTWYTHRAKILQIFWLALVLNADALKQGPYFCCYGQCFSCSSPWLSSGSNRIWLIDRLIWIARQSV